MPEFDAASYTTLTDMTALVEGADVHEVFGNRPEVLRFAESEGRIGLLQ